MTTVEHLRLEEARSGVPWRRWGPYRSEGQWGTTPSPGWGLPSDRVDGLVALLISLMGPLDPAELLRAGRVAAMRSDD